MECVKRLYAVVHALVESLSAFQETWLSWAALDMRMLNWSYCPVWAVLYLEEAAESCTYCRQNTSKWLEQSCASETVHHHHLL